MECVGQTLPKNQTDRACVDQKSPSVIDFFPLKTERKRNAFYEWMMEIVWFIVVFVLSTSSLKSFIVDVGWLLDMEARCPTHKLCFFLN